MLQIFTFLFYLSYSRMFYGNYFKSCCCEFSPRQEKLILEELPNSSEIEDMRKIR